ncbi:PKD1L2 [Lepeophtheirus salmonis]|uniref:PKD1L2 n=1 Tax=Lepeophtheirus salmonis TaxID=72036 RepID=A0A7R8CWZ3_LEPSM|nr:PKD1L2 [Lepeophtheirus salmonis]CAF2926136.1 PKD1L2 [Lepeophtheirus salmonis]
MFCRLLYINDIYSNYELEIEGTNDDGSETTTQSFYLSNPSCSNLGKTPPLNLPFSASTNYYFISATNPIILRHLGPTTSRKRFISIIGLFGPNSPNKLNLNVYNTECVLLSQSGKCLSDGLYKPPTIQTLEYSVNISTCDTNIYNIITHQCRETCNSLSCSSLEGLDYPEEFHLKDTYELVLNDNDTIKPTAQTLMYISEIEIILEEGDYLGIEGIIQIAFFGNPGAFGDSTIQEEDWVENNDYHFRIDEEIEITIDRLNGTNINYTVIWDDGSSNDTDTGDDDYCFEWKSDPNTHLPSKATIKCFWGDEAITSTEEANFEDSIYFGKMGSISYCANHTFESGGTYDLNCTMENKVSEQNLTIENVTIYVPIEGFESFLFFVPKFGDGKLIPGYGEMKSVIPHGVFSIQIIGSNVLTEAQFNLTFEIVKEIRLMSIKDDGSSTGPTETKAFEIGFDTFGSGVCIEISFGDNIIEAYGDADFCKGFVSKKSVPINNKDITNPFKIEHVYYSMGSYDVTARASNPATIEDLNVEMKNVLILNFDCKVPKVSLNLETLEPTNPFEFLKKEQVKLSAKILVNCYKVVKTHKNWVVTLMKLDSGNAKEVEIIDNSELSTQKLEIADLSILPFKFPSYGLYKVTIISRLWDDRDIGDPYLTHLLPYVGQSSTFIKILPSQLVPGLVSGGSKYISRGTGQIVDLKPYIYTYDPDNPNDKVKGIGFKWFCRHMTTLTDGEKYPLEKIDENGNTIISESNPQKIPKDKMKMEDSKGGCFGYGPGILDEYESVLLIPGSSFIKIEEKYEIMLIAEKDTRSATCTTKDNACHIDEKGNIYINPDFRLALSSSCSTDDTSDCSEPMLYEWSSTDNENLSQVDDKYFTIGSDLSDFVISLDYFQAFPNLQSFDVKLIAYNAKDDKGEPGEARPLKENIFNDFKNKSTSNGGSCSISPMKGTALVDVFSFHCFGWIDPENKKVSSYTLKTRDTSGSMTTLKQFLIFGPRKGEDKTSSRRDDLVEFQSSFGSADTGASALVLQVMSSLMKSNPNLFEEEDDENLPEDLIEFNRAVKAGMVGHKADKIELLAKLEALTKDKFTDAATMESLTQTVVNALGEPGSNTVGLAATESGLNSLENLIKNLANINIPSPDRLLTSASLIANGLGVIIDAITKPGKKSNDADEDCDNVTPVDKATAETNPIFQYDTDIGDDLEMEIPQDKDKLMCGGIKDSFKVAAKKMGGRVRDIIEDLGDATINMLVINENITIKTSKILLHVRKTFIDNLNDEIHLTNETSFQVENFCHVQRMNGSCKEPVGVIASIMSDNIYGYYDNSHLVSEDAAILDLTLKDTKTMEKILVSNVITADLNDTYGGINLKLSRATNEFTDDLKIVDAIERSKGHRIPYMHHEFTFTKTNASMTIEFILLNVSAIHDLPNMVMLLSYERIPTFSNFEYATMVENLEEIEEYHFFWYLRNEKIRNLDGRWFLTIAQLSKPLSTTQLSSGSIDKELFIPISSNYKIRPYTSGCYFFDEKRSDWFNDMNVSRTDHKSLNCRSTHLTAFAGGFFITPNTIDFEYVIAHSSFNDNLTAYFTLLLAIIIYIIMMIWAYFTDRKEKKLNFSRVCPDNRVEDKYMYEILTQTGRRYQSSCSSVVNIFISGDNGDTGLRVLRSTDVDSTLNKGDINSFILTTSGPLGNINLVRIWLNYDGESHYASWYLSSLLIRDIQTNKEFEFVVNDWFAVEKSDGKIDRRLIPATLEQKTSFLHLFTHLFEQNIKNNHFWFSVFMKQPLTSRYTTCQRVTTVFTFFFLCILLNGVWFRKFVMTEPSKFEIRMSFFKLTPIDFGMGLLSCLIANPFAYAISFLFRKSKVNRINATRFKPAITKGESDGYVFEDVAKPFKKKLCLPHWCSIIAWIISLLIMTVSFIIIWGYAISFGKDKVHQWMTSVVVSLLVDLLLFESLKVIIIAVFRSCLKKPIDLDSTDICDREILPQISTSDAWRKPEENNSYFEPYNKLTLEKLKSHRVSDVNIMAVIRDMIYYFVFLAVIVIISYGNMDTNSYLLKWNIEQRFIYDNQFDQVTNTVEWWKWAHSTILPKLRASNFYNGKPPFGLRGFLDDQVNRIMGYATLRQIRVKPNSCRVSPIVSNLTRNCAPAANIFFEDSRHYCDNWAERTDLTFDLPSCQRPEFRYENASSLQSLSYNAIMDTYSGGGYVLFFLEFSVYNANSNLFGIVTIIAEFFRVEEFDPSGE